MVLFKELHGISGLSIGLQVGTVLCRYDWCGMEKLAKKFLLEGFWLSSDVHALS